MAAEVMPTETIEPVAKILEEYDCAMTEPPILIGLTWTIGWSQCNAFVADEDLDRIEEIEDVLRSHSTSG